MPTLDTFVDDGVNLFFVYGDIDIYFVFEKPGINSLEFTIGTDWSSQHVQERTLSDATTTAKTVNYRPRPDM